MTAAFAPSPWPAPASQRGLGAWRFGREIDGDRSRTVQWEFRRNCSITPRQLLGFYVSLAGVALFIALGFWWAGATVVLAFAGFEVLMLGVALAVYARHAADCETITLAGGELAIEHRHGVAVDASRFRAEWVRVEPSVGDGSLVEVSGEGRRAQIGRYLRPEWRSQLAQEIRTALRR
ncbi:MAG: DUF2244 domain-containing protein [Burkholderiaceae bacterium]|jgi:uncharacterized membrane protein|nr:DUF2244 domain-containing protein [Burkholderiaceae bacterium]